MFGILAQLITKQAETCNTAMYSVMQREYNAQHNGGVTCDVDGDSKTTEYNHDDDL